MGCSVSVITSPRSGSSQAPPPRGGSPAPGAPPPPLPPLGPEEKPHRRPGWWRLFLGALIVLVCAAGASAVFVLEQVHTIKVALSQNKSLNIAPGELANPAAGGPETLLLVGDDTRRGFKYYRGSVPDLANEMLLVRLDPSKPYISMMSIPRELMATIYNASGQLVYVNNQPQNRLNSALSQGNLSQGIRALLSTIQHDLGLSINHVIVATFASFERAVDEMGCVYSTVDQRYYNDNIGTPETNYQSINLQPGYQRLCGQQAEEFVSYRHTDTSLVRDARDQSFLLDVKKQYGPTLIDNASKFLHIFGKAVQTDPGLQSTNEIINLLGTLAQVAGDPVRQVQFQVTLQPTGANPCSCDTATLQQITDSVHAFLYGGSPIPKQSVAAQAHAVQSKHVAARLPLTPTPSSALAQARAAALKLAFPLEYPQVEDRGGSVQSPYLRSYTIDAPGGTEYPVYVGVFYAGQLGAYYDVQGMTWTTAPQFDSPDQTVSVNGRTYYLYYDSTNLRMVAWYEHGAVYWVRNSLSNTLPNGEMLAIAEQTQPFTGVHATPTQPRVILKDANAPRRIVHKTPLTVKEKVGGIAALVTLIALPLLALLAIMRIVSVRKTRRQLRNGELRPTPGPASLGARPAFGGAGAAGWGLGSPAAPGSVASGRWVGTPTVYRRSRLRRPAVIVPIVLLVLAAAGAGAFLLLRHHAPPTPVHHVKRIVEPVIPTARVVVLNSTSTPGAAHKLAVYLQGRRVKVTGVGNLGNLSEPLPPGNEILYMPGDRSQAELLAHVLGGQVTTVPAPIDPAVAAAAGNGAQLVVVIT
jgi:LCP family protein required for cell wall assembly